MMARFLASGLVATLLLAGLQTWRLDRERLAHAITHGEHAALLAASEAAAREAEAAARLEEQRRARALQEVIHDTESKLSRARADAARAADAGRRLRQRIDEITAACRGGGAGDSGFADAGQATDAAGFVLADVQRRLDEAADAIAGFADRAHAAGLACERSFDAMTDRAAR
jgi:hypothetical protein